jgi:hypothetical protein
MKLMPPNRRGDFVYYDGQRLLSNNPALLPHVRITARRQRSRAAMAATPSLRPHAASKIRASSVGSCSPPDPFAGSGPYVREVGNCGFTGGWSIVNLECGSTQLRDPAHEDGYMYMEERDASGNTYEGGLFTGTGIANGNDIDPYLAGFGGTQLQNAGARYSCGNYLGLMAGIVNAQSGKGPMFYVSIGTIPNYNPQNAWLPTEEVTMNNAAWLFEPAPGNMNHPGFDNAGVSTPCTSCAITKVTSIGDIGGDIFDGSTFGIDPITGNNAIHWAEVTFGEWLSDCSPSLCNLEYSTDSGYWYAGMENYPNSDAAQADFNQAGAVYESYDGVVAVDTRSSPRNIHRSPSGTFVVPAPPSCDADSYGYCVANESQGVQNQGCYDGNGTYWNEPIGSDTYLIQTPTHALVEYKDNYVDDRSGDCRSYESWSPNAAPSAVYNDPNLPTTGGY